MPLELHPEHNAAKWAFRVTLAAAISPSSITFLSGEAGKSQIAAGYDGRRARRMGEASRRCRTVARLRQRRICLLRQRHCQPAGTGRWHVFAIGMGAAALLGLGVAAGGSNP